ncbi:MAG: transposase [Betaproteobacteria bacterium]
MARPRRIEFPGAVYHVTARGDRRDPIFLDDEDRTALLEVIGQALSRFDAEALAYCLMGNHYHFVLHTRHGNLSLLMRHINGVYTQTFNRRHDRVGHLFQGRFKAIIVDRDAYLLEVCRDVDLNPVRARIVRKPSAWAWSSYKAHVGLAEAPAWLDTEGLHGYLLGRPVRNDADRKRAAEHYARLLVASVPEANLWDSALRQQIYLGDEDFVERMQALAAPRNSTDEDIPKIQRRKVKTLTQWLASCATREEALYKAYTQGAMTMTAIARQLDLSISRVSRLIAQAEQEQGEA